MKMAFIVDGPTYPDCIGGAEIFAWRFVSKSNARIMRKGNSKLTKGLKIAFVIAGFAYPDVVGGAELFTHKLTQSLAKRGFEVHLIAAKGPSFRGGFNKGVYRHSINIGGRLLPFVSFLLFSLGALIKLLKVKPDVCVAIMGHSIVPCMIYGHTLKKPVIVRWAGMDYLTIKSDANKDLIKLFRLSFKDVLFSKVIARATKNSVHHIVLDYDMKRELLELGVPSEKIYLIPNYVSDDFFTVTPSYDNFNIVFVGRLVPEKGVDLLIRAFAKLAEKVPVAKLILVGDGSEKPCLQRLAKELGVLEKVTFTGFVPHSKVPELLRKASVFALPSRFEGLPNALLQAMAAALPCVATSVGGVPDVIKDGVNGILVPPEREDLLAEALETVLLNKALAMRLGENARRSVSHLRLSSITDFYHKLIVEILNTQSAHLNAHKSLV
jgi:glycosyltransferase involved in cell wall biosynthesis